MSASAVQLRRDALARLAEIAGAPRWDLDRILAQRSLCGQAWRSALRAAGDDRLLRHEVLVLAGIVDAAADVLIDATHDQTPAGAPAGPEITLDDVRAALTGWDQGAPHGQ